MIKTIAEHSYEDSLLHEGSLILDLGCRGFGFTDWMELSGYTVHSVDCDYLNANQFYYQIAISNENGTVRVLKNSDPQGTMITNILDISEYSVACLTLMSFSQMVGVGFWDLIKMDVESSEYQIIMSLPNAPAKQLSIEFHLHTGIYGDAEVKQMEDKLLSLGYFPVKHDKTNEHGAGFNYWDSLWILKSLL